MRQGERYFDGRCLILYERIVDLDAKARATICAKRLRAAGKVEFVRIVRVNVCTYDVFAL